MKNVHVYLMLLITGLCSCQSPTGTVSSPDGKIVVTFSLQPAGPVYSVFKNDTLLLDASHLGLIMADEDFSKALKLVSTSAEKRVQDNFTMLQGKRKSVHYEANERKFLLENSSGNKMEIQFRVSNDGVACLRQSRWRQTQTSD
ncbi:MAG TPA: glycoside hydrolase family 97 N-terminal domain-containing protein [Cyclobacteriaceae bacterium]|nr:glycoside hydrolase family 97 N-terminal domain-containing protein [Cyclobacteriaceae bacterium]